MRDFLRGRFKGVQPVLWGEQMPQIELSEALHCSLMGLDQLGGKADEPEKEDTDR